MRRRGSRGLALQPVEGADGREEHAKPDVHEVDVGDREHDVAGEDDSLVEHPVDELEQRYLLLERRRLEDAHGASLDSTKLYGGHGPVISNETPRPACSASSIATS